MVPGEFGLARGRRKVPTSGRRKRRKLSAAGWRAQRSRGSTLGATEGREGRRRRRWPTSPPGALTIVFRAALMGVDAAAAVDGKSPVHGGLENQESVFHKRPHRSAFDQPDNKRRPLERPREFSSALFGAACQAKWHGRRAHPSEVFLAVRPNVGRTIRA